MMKVLAKNRSNFTYLIKLLQYRWIKNLQKYLNNISEMKESGKYNTPRQVNHL